MRRFSGSSCEWRSWKTNSAARRSPPNNRFAGLGSDQPQSAFSVGVDRALVAAETQRKPRNRSQRITRGTMNPRNRRRFRGDARLEIVLRLVVIPVRQVVEPEI